MYCELFLEQSTAAVNANSMLTQQVEEKLQKRIENQEVEKQLEEEKQQEEEKQREEEKQQEEEKQ